MIVSDLPSTFDLSSIFMKFIFSPITIAHFGPSYGNINDFQAPVTSVRMYRQLSSYAYYLPC